MKKILLVLFCWLGIALVSPFFILSDGWEDFCKEVVEEYNVKLSTAENTFYGELEHEINIFPLVHNRWYVNLENGDDVTIATRYFGMVFLDTEAIEKYFHLREIINSFGDKAHYL